MKEWTMPAMQEMDVALTAYGTTPTDREFKHYAYNSEIVEWEYPKGERS